VLAHAQGDFLGAFYGKLDRTETCSFMASVAEWLFGGPTTGAPGIAAGFKLDDLGLFGRRYGVCIIIHFYCPCL
jgi:hypothetical protein